MHIQIKLKLYRHINGVEKFYSQEMLYFSTLAHLNTQHSQKSPQA